MGRVATPFSQITSRDEYTSAVEMLRLRLFQHDVLLL
jgi:hypothetical protein